MDNLITDRTYNDVILGTDKGYYNYTDLNRVEEATAELAQLLTAQGYYTTVEPYNKSTGWETQDIPTVQQMTRYLNNVKLCVKQFNAATGIELPESMELLDYIGANNIEKVLLKINELLNYMIEVLRYSGTFYSGSMDSLRGYCL